MEQEVEDGIAKVVKSSTFAVLIILIVFFPILTLTGIEGKYFTPMAQTLVFCIIGALILSLTYVPMMAALFLKKKIVAKPTFADKFFSWLTEIYYKVLHSCMRHVWKTIAVAFAMLAASLLLFTRLGAEFIPTLDEGDFAMQMTLPAGSSLSQSIELSLQAEKKLKAEFPEVKHVVAKIGTAGVPTDPMSVEDADVMIVMKPFKEWTSASSRAEMVEKMKLALEGIEGAEFNFSQPIQLRFNELMTGAKADIAIKLYGEDMEELYAKAKEAAKHIEKVHGAADVIVEQAMGLPQLVVHFDRNKLARYGIDIKELNDIIRTAYAGETAGVGFDLVVRLDNEKVSDLDLNRLFVRTFDGLQVPVSEVATIELVNGPLQINRDATKRRIVIGVNVRDADIQQVVEEISNTLERNIKLKPGYYFEYGGQFENLQNAIRTLLIVIPIALMLILLLLFFAFRSVTYSLVVFSTVPLSLIGGIVALWLRGLPFSISAGVGFIALFGVAVLNGILMINHFNDSREKGKYTVCTDRIIFQGCRHLLRPVFLTGLVASLGFVPMAIATSAGAEVQRPLATVVIGGLIVSTILTLVIIPAFYKIVNTFPVYMRSFKNRRSKTGRTLSIALFSALAVSLMLSSPAFSQEVPTQKLNETPVAISLEEAIEKAIEQSPRVKTADSEILRSKARKGEAWDGGNTSIGYAWGQLNGETHNDNEFTVEQSLGSLLTPIYKNALSKTLVSSSIGKKEVVCREVAAEVKRAWEDYLLARSMVRLANEQKRESSQLQEIAEIRFQQGDINMLEYRMIKTEAAKLNTEAQQAEDDLVMAEKRFSWACYSERRVIPQDTVLTPRPFIATEDIGEIYNKLLHLQVTEKSDMMKIEKSRYFPELSVGYSIQKIAPLKGLDSWSIGISFPLLFFPQQSRVKQAKAEMMAAQWEAQDKKIELRNTLEELQARILQKRKQLDYYESAALPEADELQRNALTLYRESETSVSELLQSLSTSRDIRKSYFSALHEYNVLIVEYDIYK